MNAIERLLSDDLARLIDRLATSVPEDAFGRVLSTTPTLRARLDQLDATLAGARAALLEDYGRWTRALDDVDNVWALAVWRAEVADEPAADAPRLAA